MMAEIIGAGQVEIGWEDGARDERCRHVGGGVITSYREPNCIRSQIICVRGQYIAVNDTI